MSDVQLHKYTKTALCGSSFLDLRFGLLGIKKLVWLRSKLQTYTLCDIFWKGNDMRTSKTTFPSIKHANTQIHLWSKLHMRPICIRFFKTGPSGYPIGLFGSPTASSGDPTGPSGDPSGRPYIAHCTMLPLATKSCLKSSKLRLTLNSQFCNAISKNICCNVLGSKQPWKILVFVIFKL